MADDEDPYDTLLVSRSATAAEIRRSYQELARKCHPDKLTATEAGKAEATEKFQKINKAYELLSNPDSRREYDASIAAGELRQQWPLSATVDLDTLDYREESGTYSTTCRCGGSYTLSEEEMERGVDTVCCSMCTLAIRVLYKLADTEDDDEGEGDVGMD